MPAASLWRVGNATIPNPNGTGTITRRVVQPRVGYTAYQRYERDQLALSHTGRYGFGTWQTTLTSPPSGKIPASFLSSTRLSRAARCASVRCCSHKIDVLSGAPR